jgi:uncharacterized protein (DUF433 family)
VSSTPATGDARSKWVSGFATETTAKAARDDARVSARRGEYIDNDAVTVAAYLHEWLDTHAGSVKLKTLRLPQYPREAEVVIDPRFGWGVPVLARSSVPVDALVALWKNGESIEAVSEEYELPTDVVENVLRQAA